MSKVLKVTAIAGAVGLALYAGIGYLGVPYAVKSSVEHFGSDQLKAPVKIDNVSFNPWTWELSVKGLNIGEKDKPIVHLGALYVDVSSKSVTERAPVIEAISVIDLAADIDLDSKEVKNLTEANASQKAPAEKKAEPAGLPRFAVYNILVRNGSVKVRSAKDGIDEAITDVNVELPFVSTLESSQESLVTPRLAFKVNGTPVTATGSTKPFGTSLEATLNARIDKLDLRPFAVLAPQLHELGLSLKSGTLSTNSTVVFQNATGSNPGKILVSGRTSIDDVSLVSAKGERFGVKGLAVDLEGLDPIAHNASVKSVTIDNPRVVLEHTKDGIEGLAGIDPHKSAAAPAAGSAPAAPAGAAWTWRLGSLNLNDGYIDWSDRSMARPARVTVSRLSAEVAGLSSNPEETGRFKASLRTLGGTLSAEGTVKPASSAVHVTAKGSGLDVKYVAPYIEHYAKLGLSAVAGFNMNVIAENGAVAASGTASVDRFAINKGKSAPVRFNHFDVDITRLDTAKELVAVKSVNLDRADIDFIVTKDGSNLASLAGGGKKDAKADGKKPEASKDATPAWRWSIDDVKLTNSKLRFEDATKKGSPSVVVTNMSAHAANLSSAPKTVSSADFSARLGRGGIAGKGTFSLDPLTADMAVDLSNVELKPLSGLMTAYAGIGAGSGRLDVKGVFDMKDGGETPAIDWKGDVRLADFDLLNGAGKSLMVWKNAALEGMNVHTKKPVSFEIKRVEIAQPGTKATRNISKATKTISALAGLFGEKKAAKEIGRVNETLDKNIELTDVSYKNGNLTANGISSNAVAGALMKSLEAELAKVLK